MSRSPTKLATGQVQLNTTTATLIVAERAGRVKLRLRPAGGMLIGDVSLTISNGYLLNSSTEYELETGAAVYGIGANASDVSYMETYD